MVKCKECSMEMRNEETKSCDDKYITIQGKRYKRNTTYFDHGNTRDSKNRRRCHDCGILNKKGNTHHFGCDMERCPNCKEQLISCGCLD